ncbi:MAG: type I DNA topoisomerase [Candidatus Paceibacterota bacterium]|jgi:DNA topoisomerase-1
MNLVIVESPTKSKTISKLLGKDYKVLSSYGHVRDLPKSKLGIDVENDFKPEYVIPTRARKNVNLLKKEAKESKNVILATDEDREGEAIAYHLSYILGLKDNYQRIAFHEITESAIREALKNPRKINMDLVDAQQARRMLDRIVGYKLSPFLWKKIARGLSAGRVQSVALRLVVEREREIEKFKPQEYWSVIALLRKDVNEFEASLVKKDGKPIDKLEIKNEQEAKKILGELEGATYEVESVEKKEVSRSPLPPFTTSTLQQEASKKLGYSAKFTMSLAQKLYENGFITYHRTDSLNLSEQSLFAAKDFIIKEYGEKYWEGFPRRFKTKSKGAQEAHEAIRPSYPDKTPESLKMDEKQHRLYVLIWKRFVASQMSKAVFNTHTADIRAGIYGFRVSGQILKFDGFLRIYPIKFEEKEIPELKVKDILDLKELKPEQHFTQPPARYNEASLIKALEENGIGRPSTYAPILSNIQDRNYIEKNEQRRFQPTEIGTVVNDLLVENFPQVVDINFTAQMEEELDKVAQGEKKLLPVIEEFYDPFMDNLEEKYKSIEKKEIAETPTDKICPKCSSPLIIKLGRYGRFYACSNFPKCKYTESLEQNNLNIQCPKCKEGELVPKRTRTKKVFYGCSNYPKCDYALWYKPTGKFCPKCNAMLVESGKKWIKCSNKECVYKVEKEEKM